MFALVVGVVASLQLKPELRKDLELPITREQPTPFPIIIEEENMLDKVVTAVFGYVVSGGDTTPEGLLDTPRKFVFKIKKDSGIFVNVTYTAYPPSPVGDREMGKIRLNFHTGTIRVGDYLITHGVYDKKTDMVVVAQEGDYIETYFERP
ncbi:MAG TPA: hypothetical protein VMX76_00380 [Nevskiaceae bacterium]|nr:hypothetical protein [Nevskiaceae bacterium]